MKKFIAGLFLALALLLPRESHAQAVVVSTCGALGQTYAPGSTRNPAIDINGNNCNAPSASQAVTGSVTLSSQFPSAATPISGNAAGSTGAVVGTLAAAAAKTTYICGFNVSAVGGVAAVGPITVAGLVGSSQVYQLNSAAAPVQLSQNFSPCIPASAVNTAITITTTANLTATAVDVNSWGFQQ